MKVFEAAAVVVIGCKGPNSKVPKQEQTYVVAYERHSTARGYCSLSVCRENWSLDSAVSQSSCAVWKMNSSSLKTDTVDL